MINNFLFSPINNSDLIKIDNLNREIYGIYPELNSAYKLNTFYAKDKNLGILVKDNNSLICTYLVFPISVNYKNQTFWVCQSGNTMLVEKYLGSDLVIKSANLVYEDIIKKNYNGVFGFPSKSILRTRTKRLGWIKGSQINSYFFYLPTVPLFFFTKYSIHLKKIHKKYIELFINLFLKEGEIFDSSNKFNFTKNTAYIERSEQFWDYKLKNKDNYLIKIHGINLVFKFDRHIYIGDIDVSKKQLTFLFFIKLFFFLIFTFNLSIKFYCSEDSTLDNYLKKFLKPKKVLHYCFRNFSDKIDLSKVKFTYFDFDTF